ncbi:hypothetical protein JRO89_XS04G0164400 [Xanthoceras sorbifolium]|uniref:Uncharacterized protein n=1 Tax=Xanthoceras sorbifolium TaxID=99658 RepID=A0ABQ8I5I7_9ROSI|nr:hypothetical protein JRO89_XS04G0164400 [Xanthoceras sorbifolium]
MLMKLLCTYLIYLWENTFGFHHLVICSFFLQFLNTDGMKVKADRDESSLYAIMLAAQDISQRCKVKHTKYGHSKLDVFVNSFIFYLELGITALHIKLRATGTDFNPSYLCKNDFDFHIFMFGA